MTARTIAPSRWPRETRVSPRFNWRTRRTWCQEAKISTRHAGCDQRRPEPDRESVRARLKTGLDESNLLQEKTEARHDETEAHQREARANPGEKSPLGGEIVAYVAVFRSLLASLQSWIDRTKELYRSSLSLEDDAAGDDGGHGRAAEGAAVEGSVARFAGRFGGAVRPFVIGRENGEVGRLAGGDFALDAENARGAGGEKFDEAHQRKFSGVHELARGRARAPSRIR